MLRKIAAAILIVLVGAVSTAPAGAEPRGRGQHSDRSRRYRQWRGRRQYWRPDRGWGYENPLGSLFGGIIGGWLGSQMGRDDER